jgi:hypothetical protein
VHRFRGHTPLSSNKKLWDVQHRSNGADLEFGFESPRPRFVKPFGEHCGGVPFPQTEVLQNISSGPSIWSGAHRQVRSRHAVNRLTQVCALCVEIHQ